VSEFEVQDFPGTDENGDFGLVPMMRAGGGQWQPFDLDAVQAHRAVSAGRNILEQDVWWTGRDNITRLIDSLDDEHRRFIARLLVDQAARMHAARRMRQIVSDYWAYIAYADEKGVPLAGEDEPTRPQMLATIRAEQEHGEHLTELRTSKLFRRMIRGLNWTHPGVDDTTAAAVTPQ
jgi:hypothetical protein